MAVQPLDLSRLKVFPLAERASLTRADEILRSRFATEAAVAWNRSRHELEVPRTFARSGNQRLRDAHDVPTCCGTARPASSNADGDAKRLAHAPRHERGRHHPPTTGNTRGSGPAPRVSSMGVAGGKFGTWHETATNIHLAIMAGALDGLGYGRSLGRFIHEDGATLPTAAELEAKIVASAGDALTAARADLLHTMRTQGWPAGRIAIDHRWKHASILAQAWKHCVPVTVHPGIGYDIISNHPVFSGSAIGRGAEWDFKLFGGSVDGLDGGVVLSVGSAIMGPQVFEKSISCVNNLRLQQGRDVVKDHAITVVDLQDGGGWDWTAGEPPKTNPAYYLRFCKSYSRMGGAMQYLQCDNAAFIHNLYRELSR
ncbi:MAG: hypothetical protein U0792_25685 [Gemmataceae bacterium]